MHHFRARNSPFAQIIFFRKPINTLCRVFQIAEVGGEEGGGGISNFSEGGGIFLPREGNLKRRGFDDSNSFQSEKQLL